ncbi:unnamed protein product [Rotaria sordida]|uniref:Cation-transporting P-type ATPase N-terminal domain-containing protein n=1 Tax=Rotaria sordida TaxID=392033 RepID=A0A814K4E9_9BILA|nr:unnamed protein product [Rotaria sordida]CAF3598555.1 unnamed protein product [Rotaria sordida]
MERQSVQNDNKRDPNIHMNTPDQSSMSQDSTVELWTTTEKSHPEQETVHMIPLEKLFQRFHTNPTTGLASNFILDARTQYGDNKLTPPKPPNYFWLLFKQLFAGFNSILWFAGIIAILAYKSFGAIHPDPSNLALGILIFIVIILNSILNSYQEIKSIKIVTSFSKLLPTLATVRRDGTEQQILTDEIIPGDIILIRMGDKLPADCRFISCDNLKVNTSELTGESIPVSITVQYTSINFMETRNIGFYSSMVEQGTGEAVVIATGDNTVLGKMSKLTRRSTGDEITGLHREVNRFILFVVLITLTGIAVLWITWGEWLKHHHPGFISYNDNIVNTVGLIVAFLPMGLPSAVTLVLTIVAKQMYRQHVLVKSLQIVETFNSVSVIATDKTGTLTQNKMTVTHLLWDTDCIYDVPMPQRKAEVENTFFRRMRAVSLDAIKMARRLSDSVYRLARELSSSSRDESECIPLVDNNAEKSDEPSEIRIQAFRDLLLGAALCNDADKQIAKDVEFDHNKIETKLKLKLVGDAADTALYHLCVDQCSVDINKVRNVNPRLKVLPFNSSNKFMISANQLETLDFSISEKDRTVLIILKGAPDIVIQRCSTYKTNVNEILSLDSEVKNALFTRQEKLGENGYRVMAMCQQKLSRQQYDNMMEKYNARKGSSVSEENEDLNGFPSNDYCFIGLFSLLDPSRLEVPDAVLKARRAQIRIAMITGDHPTTAKAIAKQVNIFTSDITDTNGIDTFKVEKNEDGKFIFNLYRNDKLIEQYEPHTKKKDDLQSKNIKHLTKQISIEFDKYETQEKPWYKRVWLSFRNRFKKSENEIDLTVKKEYIPYAIIIAGTEINYMDDFMWDWVLSHQELVFARTSPEQKLYIVKEFQRRAEIVAVTGDGTNDAPALKCANLGVAMQSGTEVSKEAGDMILLDNNFTSIIRAIEAGRLLSDNLKKVAIYLLPAGSWSQIWPVFFCLWFGIPLALPAFYATVFCMLNDVFMSLAMVAEKAECDIMSRPPSIRSKDHLLNWKLLLHAYMFVGNLECFTGFFCFCYYWIDNDVPFYSFMFTYEKFGIDPVTPYSIEQLTKMTYVSQSIYYCSLCLFQFFNYFATRTRYASILEHNPFWGKGRNWYVFGAMSISVGIQILITKVKWFNRIFHTAPVPVKYVMPTLGFGMLWLIIDELRKYLIRKFPNSFLAKIAW